MQDGLSSNLGAPVQAAASQSSLQLALENEKLKDAQDVYLKALLKEGEKADDVVGYVFAINGKLNSAEVYPSNGLFRKMWPKLLQASVTEAIGQKNSGVADPTPTSDAALAFLTDAAKGASSETPLPASVRLETRRPTRRSISRRGARTAPSCIAAIWRSSGPAHRGPRACGGQHHFRVSRADALRGPVLTLAHTLPAETGAGRAT